MEFLSGACLDYFAKTLILVRDFWYCKTFFMVKKNKYVDLSYLENMSGGSKELVKEMVDIFISQVPEFTSEMKSLLAKRDYQSLGMLAHKAKSSVAIMGMEELAKYLKEFELLAKEGKNTESYSDMINKFEADCNTAITELKEIIGDL